jgi:ABC-type nitrate/sulfonate/bicarbonate transport system substrate-binding protein
MALSTQPGGASRRAFVSAVAASALVPVPALAQAVPVRVIGFFSGTTLPLWVADTKGFFARENLNVTLTPTPGSVYQFQHLSAGDFEIGATALDNIVAYDDGEGEAPLPNPPDFVAIMGGDSGFLQLWARPEITSYADFRGKLLAVDAIRTGFTFVLRRMLQQHGVAPGTYDLVPVGNTGARLARMQQGTDCVGGLLAPPADVAARAAGLKLMDVATDVIGAYQAGVLVARRSWLAGNGETAVRFIRAARAALAWIYSPANRGEAAALLAERTKIAVPAANALLPTLVDPKIGFDRNGSFSSDGIRNVLALRAAYTGKPTGDPLKYYDPSYYRRSG